MRIKQQRQIDSAMVINAMNHLRSKAFVMGMELVCFDANGNFISSAEADGDFCRMCMKADDACLRSHRKLAINTLEWKDASRSTSPMGCCLIGLPVIYQERIVGVVTVGYPSIEMQDEEHMARLCDNLCLDKEAMDTFAKETNFFSAKDVNKMQSLFQLLLDDWGDICRDRIEMEELTDRSDMIRGQLSLMFQISESMSVTKEPQRFLKDFCTKLHDVMDLEVAAALVAEPSMKLCGDIVIHAGSEDISPSQIRLVTAVEVANKMGPGQRYIANNDLIDEKQTSIWNPEIRNLAAASLNIKGECVGYVVGLNKKARDFDLSDQDMFLTVANQASQFLENHSIYAELNELLDGTLHSLTESIDAKDPYTCGHSRRVAEMSRMIAIGYGMTEAKAHYVYLAGLLHDVGKIGVPESILLKKGRLTDEEFDAIRQHPVISSRILRRIRNLVPVMDGVLSHHERIDGRGYPHGLSGELVPLSARIVGLADSWDAMTSDREYRRALSIDHAVQELKDCAGQQFDPDLVDIVLSWDLKEFMKELHSMNTDDLTLM